MKEIILIIIFVLSWSSTYSQTIFIEFTDKKWHSPFEGSYQGLSLLYDINDKWSIGPNFHTYNEVYYFEYADLFANPIDFNPIHNAYRIRGGRTIVDSPEFYRGLGADGLKNNIYFATNGWQVLALGLSVNYKIINKNKWLWYARVLPSFQRGRFEYIQTGINGSRIRINPDEEYHRVFYTEKNIRFDYFLSIQFGTGVMYNVYGNLSVGIDLSTNDTFNHLVIPAATISYSLN